MFWFNPFTSSQKIKFKITCLKKRYANFSRRELADMIIKERCRQCALVGALTALPAVIPGIGTIVSFLGGVAVDIMLLTYLLTQLALEIATVYERDLTQFDYQKEAFGAFILATGAGSIGSVLSRTLTSQLSKDGFTILVEKFLISLGARATFRSTIVRLIPLAGLILTGYINYWLGRKVGQHVLNYYENQNNESKPAIDVDYFFYD